MGASRKPIDENEVYKLASYGCTQEEIADFFGVVHTTIGRTYAQAYKLGKANVRRNVRMWQMKRAKKGSDKMLIHLGQHYCGQTPKLEVKDTRDAQDERDFLDHAQPPKTAKSKKAKPKPGAADAG